MKRRRPGPSVSRPDSARWPDGKTACRGDARVARYPRYCPDTRSPFPPEAPDDLDPFSTANP
jgi:hypothetical protein